MKLRQCASAALLGACALFLTKSARADGIRVLFRASEITAFSARMRAEIAALGFDLVAEDSASPEALTSGVKAAAYVIEAPPPRRIELWLQNERTGELELSAVVTAPADASESDDAPEITRAAEQLRAFFQPLRDATPAPPPAAPAAPEIVRVESEREPGLEPSETTGADPTRITLEGALALPIDSGGAGLDAYLRGGAWFSSRWGVGGKLVFPIVGSRVEASSNSATLSTALLGPELWLRLFDRAPLSGFAHAGVALAWLRASGDASEGYVSRTAQAFAAFPSLGVTLEHSFSRWSVAFGAEAGFAAPAFEVVFSGQKVATASEPLGLLSLGISVEP